ncbi:hypothetical protein MK805_12040 [Shimazuella sp. AN120528]|uniref:hypothetical protein n=1 Tax=Shimazuella soli TaxID=1892854 RepID=UPI001F101DC6|nr:hypothetical protein [Shimazuella soli]MCH5585675.1 hypothetical protein [Shimazuella soli]
MTTSTVIQQLRQGAVEFAKFAEEHPDSPLAEIALELAADKNRAAKTAPLWIKIQNVLRIISRIWKG